MEGTQQNHNQPTETRTEVHLNTLSLVNQSSHFSYVYKKTEKLVTAIYMITNFIKDNEPLKWKFRENALKLLSLNRAFTTVSLSERKDLIKEYQAVASEIVSLAGIASHGGLISEMNAGVISREFSALVLLMEKEENKKANDETVSLEPGFFQVAARQSHEVYTSTPVAPLSTITVEQTPHRENVLYTPRPVQAAETTSDKGHVTEKGETKSEYLPIKDAKEKAAKSSDPKDSRQTIILKILSKKGGLNVKDFEEAIKGVSTKTIQRELLSMVASGVLKKEGERRWSTYSLA